LETVELSSNRGKKHKERERRGEVSRSTHKQQDGSADKLQLVAEVLEVYITAGGGGA
jgi:hypothetical protein